MKETFQTTDFSLAATLATFGVPVCGLDRGVDPRRVHFVFEKTADTEQLIEDFWGNKLKVEPKTFCMQQKSLKSQLYHAA